MNETDNRQQSERESLKDDVRNVLEEACMVLPGIQALIGFQTMAVFNQRFAAMSVEVKSAYPIALGPLILGMGLVMLAFAIDVYVVAVAAIGSSTVGVGGAVGTVVFLTGL